MKSNPFKHLDLCPDCEEKVDQYILSHKLGGYGKPARIVKRKRDGIYSLVDYHKRGKRRFLSLKTKDEMTARFKAAELGFDTET